MEEKRVQVLVVQEAEDLEEEQQTKEREDPDPVHNALLTSISQRFSPPGSSQPGSYKGLAPPPRQ